MKVLVFIGIFFIYLNAEYIKVSSNTEISKALKDFQAVLSVAKDKENVYLYKNNRYYEIRASTVDLETLNKAFKNTTQLPQLPRENSFIQIATLSKMASIEGIAIHLKNINNIYIKPLGNSSFQVRVDLLQSENSKDILDKVKPYYKDAWIKSENKISSNSTKLIEVSKIDTHKEEEKKVVIQPKPTLIPKIETKPEVQAEVVKIDTKENIINKSQSSDYDYSNDDILKGIEIPKKQENIKPLDDKLIASKDTLSNRVKNGIIYVAEPVVPETVLTFLKNVLIGEANSTHKQKTQRKCGLLDVYFGNSADCVK